MAKSKVRKKSDSSLRLKTVVSDSEKSGIKWIKNHIDTLGKTYALAHDEVYTALFNETVTAIRKYCDDLDLEDKPFTVFIQEFDEQKRINLVNHIIESFVETRLNVGSYFGGMCVECHGELMLLLNEGLPRTCCNYEEEINV